MLIRLATLADLPQIVAIYNSTIPSRQVTADLEPVTVESRRAWFDEHQAETRPMWIAENEHGEISGWLSFSNFHVRCAYNSTAELSIYLHEHARGLGLGTTFLQKAIADAPGIGVHTLTGLIFGHNQPSLKLFAKFGFERWGFLPRVALLDGVERDLVIVGLRVASSN